MKLIGLTGGIGSGKSTVAGLFRTLGIPVYESDLHAKTLMHEDDSVRHQIIDLFGPESYSQDLTLNRGDSGQVFNDPLLLKNSMRLFICSLSHRKVSDQESHEANLSYSREAILFEETLPPA